MWGYRTGVYAQVFKVFNRRQRTMMNWVRWARQELRETWISIQVEYQGSYSEERLRQLGNYMSGSTTRKILLILTLTPLPCLALSLAKETLPLAPAEAGVYKNGIFFGRSWVVLLFMGVSALVQMRQGAPRLELTNRQIAFVSLLAATVSAGFIYGLCVLTIFPLPFGLLIAGPPFVVVIGVCFVYISGSRWRADPSLLVDVKRQLVVYQCQTTLPFIYPLYIWGFVSLTGWNQVVFVVVLPIIQVIAKNWISRALADDYDQKPQCVIFVVEVYNALYVSNVLQTATSWTSTAAIMAVDLIQFWVSMIDIVKILDDVKNLMTKIPRDHPAANDMVQIAVCLMEIESHEPLKEISNSCSKDKIVDMNTIHDDKKLKWKMSQTARVYPLQPHQDRQSKLHLGPEMKLIPEQKLKSPTAKRPTLGLELYFTQEQRKMFIQKIAHVLFITEYLVLVEYVEAVLPFVYCLHQLALFHMHNGAYYPALTGISSDQFASRMRSTLLYSLFEFASFIMLIGVLKRKLGYSSLQQLAFVLDAHAGKVQTKLNLIFVYIMQVSLVHHGADFSFKFAWMNLTKN